MRETDSHWVNKTESWLIKICSSQKNTKEKNLISLTADTITRCLVLVKSINSLLSIFVSHRWVFTNKWYCLTPNSSSLECASAHKLITMVYCKPRPPCMRYRLVQFRCYFYTFIVLLLIKYDSFKWLETLTSAIHILVYATQTV